MSIPLSPASDDLLPITEVERLTGIRQSTLRMWEKRYGFPRPLRDRHGDRVYPPEQVEQLRAARRLMQEGLRPGRIFAADGGAGARPRAAAAAPLQDQYRHPLALLRAYQLAPLQAWLQASLARLGLRSFVGTCLAPLAAAADEAGRGGELAQRHLQLLAQLAAPVLQAQLALLRAPGGERPRAIVASLEPDTAPLELLMAEAVLASIGLDCLPLGAGMPPQEVAAAAIESGAGIVVLWYGSGAARRGIARPVQALRGALPPQVVLLAGGSGTRGLPSWPAGVGLAPDVDALAMVSMQHS